MATAAEAGAAATNGTITAREATKRRFSFSPARARLIMDGKLWTNAPPNHALSYARTASFDTDSRAPGYSRTGEESLDSGDRAGARRARRRGGVLRLRGQTEP